MNKKQRVDTKRKNTFAQKETNSVVTDTHKKKFASFGPFMSFRVSISLF